MEKPATVSSPRDQPLMSQHFALVCTHTLNLDYLPPTHTYVYVTPPLSSPLCLCSHQSIELQAIKFQAIS